MNKYRIKIVGKNPRFFLKKLILNKINLYDIREKDNNIYLTVNESDYKKILKLKTSYKVKIVNNFGLLKIKYLIEKYKYILVSLLFMIGVIIVLSNMVFQIEVVHQKEEIKELLLNDLEEFGLKKYHFKISYKKKEEIKEKILNKEREKIEWLEIKNIGTKYIINVEERKINHKKESTLPRDIIAKKDGMILELNVDEGEIVKKKYDYVRKGEVIISGTIMNKDREVAKVHSKGIINAEVWYKVSVELPKTYHEEIRTNKTYKSLTFKIINKKFSIPPSKNNKSYDIEDKVIFENKLFPIGLYIETKHEIKMVDKKFNLGNCEIEAIKIASTKLQKKLSSNSSILSKKVLKKTLKNSTILVEVFFKVKEDITDYKEISPELKEGDDSEGNN